MSPALPPHQESAFATLRNFARKRPLVERCEMCNRELALDHEHLVDPTSRRLVCACIACALPFENQAGTKFKRVPRRVLFLPNFQLTDSQWDALMIPIEMAFFFKSTAQQRVVALYPSPAGPTESLLSLDTWADMEERNPVLREMVPDVTALLVNRVAHVRGAAPPEYFLVPIDECYKLVGIIRTYWRGFSGGAEVWQEIAAFFASLHKRATPSNGADHA
jgi:Family of unknown function (DUF5947)